MGINRRSFLLAGTAAGASWAFWNSQSPNHLVKLTADFSHSASITQPAFGIIPVVGDGKWIWKEPPKDETGYLEPRDFDVSVGMSFTGRGNGRALQATTVVPVNHPEQKIVDYRLETDGCAAQVSAITPEAGQLLLRCDRIRKGQMVQATAHYRLRVSKSYHGFHQDQFPGDQRHVRRFDKRYLGTSPGIKSNSTLVKRLASELVDATIHPWNKARCFHEWVFKNIEGVPQEYTSVDLAIKNRRGDCEERACVFIALCRAAGIPARQVWVPSHVWAEIGLHDHDGQCHWIPVHTAAYSWFGWTGAHEVILQKGDHIRIPHRKQTVRLIDDWYQIQGPKPQMVYSTRITPVASDGGDPGPGARVKEKSGKWRLFGQHPLNQYMRDQ